MKEIGEKKKKYLNGRWAQSQNDRFMTAVEKYGRNWIEVQKKVKTRSIAQVRSHAQKVFLNMSKDDVNALLGLLDDESSTHHHPRMRNGQEDFMSVKESMEEEYEESQKNVKGDVLNEEMNEVKQEEQKETEKENITNLEQSGKKQNSKNEPILLKKDEFSEPKNSFFMEKFRQYQKYFQNGGNFIDLTLKPFSSIKA